MLYKELKSQLKAINQEVVPDKSWVKNNREILLSQISNTVNVENKTKEKFSLNQVWSSMSIFIPNRLVFGVVRPVAVFSLVLIVASSGWIASVGASQNALPGDWLYPVKISAEKTKIAAATLMGSKKAETQYRVEAATNRAHEVQAIVKQNDSSKKVLVATAISDLNKTILEVNKNLDEIKTDASLTDSGDVVKSVAAQTAGITLALKEAQTNLFTNNQADGGNNQNKLIAQELAGAKESVKSVEEKAVEVAVSKHLEGDSSITPTDVATLVDNSLQSALNETTQSAQSVQAVDNAVSLVKSAPVVVTGTPGEAINTANNKAADLFLAEQLGQKIEAVASKTQEATKQAQAASGAVEQKVNEVKQLMSSSSSSLNSVLDKLKEVNSAAATAEKLSVDTLNTVKEALPDVKVIANPTATSGIGIDIPVIATTTVVKTSLDTKVIQTQ